MRLKALLISLHEKESNRKRPSMLGTFHSSPRRLLPLPLSSCSPFPSPLAPPFPRRLLPFPFSFCSSILSSAAPSPCHLLPFPFSFCSSFLTSAALHFSFCPPSLPILFLLPLPGWSPFPSPFPQTPTRRPLRRSSFRRSRATAKKAGDPDPPDPTAPLPPPALAKSVKSRGSGKLSSSFKLTSKLFSRDSWEGDEETASASEVVASRREVGVSRQRDARAALGKSKSIDAIVETGER